MGGNGRTLATAVGGTACTGFEDWFSLDCESIGRLLVGARGGLCWWRSTCGELGEDTEVGGLSSPSS
jgi:hypothetical protein